MHSQTQKQPSGLRAQPTTERTLMAYGFRTREEAGLCCSWTTYLALQRQHEPVPCHATCNRGGGYRFATAGMHMRSESRRRPPTCRAEQLPSTLSHLCWATACLSSSFPEPPINGVLRFLPDPSLPRLCRPCRPLEPGIELLVLPQRQPPWIAISQPLHVRLLLRERLHVRHLQP